MGGYNISFPTWCLEWGGSRGYAATEAGDIVKKNKKNWDLYFVPLMDFRRCCCWQSTYISTLLLSSQFLRRNRRWRVDRTPIPKASTAVGTFSIRRTSLRTSKSMSSKILLVSFSLYLQLHLSSLASRSSFCSPLAPSVMSCPLVFGGGFETHWAHLNQWSVRSDAVCWELIRPVWLWVLELKAV